MERSPNLLVNVTNDAWFAGSAEGELHLRLAVLRAIETRRDLVRAVNRGPTTFVDATGRVARALRPRRCRATLSDDARAARDAATLYARSGDAPLVLLASCSIADRLRHRARAPQNADGRRLPKEGRPRS